MVRGRRGDERKRPTNLIPARLGSLVAGVHVTSFNRWQKQYSNYTIPQRTDWPTAIIIVARGNAPGTWTIRIFLANGHSQFSGHNSALLTMAVGQLVLVFPLSRGDAPGYVERGLWPSESAVNAGAESVAEWSLIRLQRAGNGSLTTRSLIAPDVTTSQLCYLCASVFTIRVSRAEEGWLLKHRGTEEHRGND
jgi:hypothetical protein